MGMFDYVEYEGNHYQSKDLNCLMDCYRIKNGRLLTDLTHIESNDEVAEPGKWVAPFKRVLDKENHDTNFHGVLNFYGEDENGVWTEFYAKFTEGNLVEVKKEKAQANG